MAAMPSFDPFDVGCEPSSVGPRWKRWLKLFQNFLAAMNITDDDRKKALLLHYSGGEVFDIFETLDSTIKVKTPATANAAAVNETAYEASVRALQDYFNPRQNVDFEILVFRQASQYQDEPFDAFHTRLQQLATNCGFTNKDQEVKAQIVQGCYSSELRKKILEEPQLTLDQVRTKGRAIEIATLQASMIEQRQFQQAMAINAGFKSSHHNSRAGYASQPSSFGNQAQPMQPHGQQQEGGKNFCSYCGGDFHPRLFDCPARNHQCSRCRKLHHFESMCRSLPWAFQPQTSVSSIHQQTPTRAQESLPSTSTPGTRHQARGIFLQPTQEADYTSDDDSPGHVYQLTSGGRANITFGVEIGGTTISMIADTGASVTIIDNPTYHLLGRPALAPTLTKVFTYGSKTPLELHGEIQVTINYEGRRTFGVALVAKGDGGNILSGKMSANLGLILMANSILTRSANEIYSSKAQQQHKYRHPKLSENHGRIREVTIRRYMDTNNKPVVNQSRRVPPRLTAAVEKKLQQLENSADVESEPSKDHNGTDGNADDKHKSASQMDADANRRARQPFMKVEKFIVLNHRQDRATGQNTPLTSEVVTSARQHPQVATPAASLNRDIKSIPKVDNGAFDDGAIDSSKPEGKSKQFEPEDRPSILQQPRERNRNRLAPDRLKYVLRGGTKK